MKKQEVARISIKKENHFAGHELMTWTIVHDVFYPAFQYPASRSNTRYWNGRKRSVGRYISYSRGNPIKVDETIGY